jgi:hypothetical protein
MTTCMDSTQLLATAFDVATTDTTGGGGGCILLNTPGDDSANCPIPGTATTVNGSLDAAVSSLGLCLPAPGLFQVDNIIYTGSVFPSGAPPSSVCGYSGGDLSALVSAATTAAGGACSIMVLCGATTLPASGGISDLPCYSSADVQFTVVAYTTDSWTCTGTCP